MNIALWIQYLFAVSLLIATPGTAVALVMQISKMPWMYIWATIAGGNLSSGLLLCCAIWGIDWLADKVDLSIIQILGGLYLIYIGISQLFVQSEMKNGSLISTTVWWRCFARAFIAGISNPKDILFFMSFLSYFLAGDNSISRSGLLLLTWLIADLMIMWGYACLFRKQSIIPHQWLSRIGSVCMMVIGLLLVVPHAIK